MAWRWASLSLRFPVTASFLASSLSGSKHLSDVGQTALIAKWMINYLVANALTYVRRSA